jgi:hypothetical protein
VFVEEPSIEDTIEILKGLRTATRRITAWTITDEAIEAAAKLSGAVPHGAVAARQGDRPDRRGGRAST